MVGFSFLHHCQSERKLYENKNIVIPHSAGLGVALNPQLSTAHAQGTAFTYQGRLNFNGNPAAGNFDVRFAVFDANTNGNQFGVTLTNSATAVTNGLFAVTLDFGAGIFTGPSRWLEIAARTNGNGAFATLAPRQALTPTPYAIYANTASNVLGSVPASQVSGVISPAQLPANVITNTQTGVTEAELFPSAAPSASRMPRRTMR